MNLFNTIHLIGIVGVAMLFSSCGGNQKTAENEEESKPNIIYIMADDLGYGDVGVYGSKHIKTPNIDKMAEQGMMFTRHYAGSPVCAPSRCMLMTGKHSGNAIIRGNMQVEPSGQLALPAEEITVAELLKEAGYTTAMIGKWGLGIQHTEGEPDKQGFDYYYGYLDQVLAHNYYPEYLIRNGESELLPNEVKYLDTTAWHKGLGSYSTVKEVYSNDLFTQDALKYLDEHKDTAFFLYLPYTIPHDNGEAPEGEKQEVPDLGIYAGKDWPGESQAYAAMITRLDEAVGLIMQKLDEHGLAENTLLIFTSDNGPMQEENHLFARFHNSNGNLRGAKRDLYEGGIRIPFVAFWPGQIEAGTSTDHISAFWDFMPTACDIAGLPIPEFTDGISMLPVLTGREQPVHDYLYWEFPEKGYQQAVLKGNWKAVRTDLLQNPNAPFELFNLETDESETTNVAEEFPEVVKELAGIAEEARTQSAYFPMPK